MTPPLETLLSLDELTRKYLMTGRDEYFSLLLWSTFLVGIGVVLEGFEVIHEIRKELLGIKLFARFGWPKFKYDLKIDRASGRPQSSANVKLLLAAFGWALVSVGVVAEFWFERVIEQYDLVIRQVEDELSLHGALETSRANERAEEAEQRILTEIEARVRAEESIAWRKFSNSQLKGFVADLSQFSGHVAVLWFHAGDKEGETFARQIGVGLNRAHWHVFGPGSVIDIASVGPFAEDAPGSETGIHVSGPLDREGHALAQAVSRAFISRGFDAATLPDSRRPKGSKEEIEITVDVRPEGPQGEAKPEAAIR